MRNPFAPNLSHFINSSSVILFQSKLIIPLNFPVFKPLSKHELSKPKKLG